ncbi:hypothetical protein B4099_0552 [Heyndrickxia coagulans]|uniref:Uncharacterized protein n=1 Tax=Heyndrickxia coagulans TaxID=1398 RepID=A0A150KIJ3_HEYCO|nr:hypothetical protein B4099_0552 [Heyndrickxia coagulans]
MLARMELDPAKMRLLYGFFDFYLKLNEKEKAEVMENIKMLDPDEAKQVLKLPNSYLSQDESNLQKGELEGARVVVPVTIWKCRIGSGKFGAWQALLLELSSTLKQGARKEI